RAEPALPVEPASVQSVHAERKPGTTLGLSLRRGNGQLSGEVDGSTALAAPARIYEARRHVDQAPRRDSELLPHQGALWSRRGRQRQYPHADQPRARLHQHTLPAAESPAHGRHQHGIRGFSEDQESRVECSILLIPAESRFSNPEAALSSWFDC